MDALWRGHPEQDSDTIDNKTGTATPHHRAPSVIHRKTGRKSTNLCPPIDEDAKTNVNAEFVEFRDPLLLLTVCIILYIQVTLYFINICQICKYIYLCVYIIM